MVDFLDHEYRPALAENAAVAVPVERPARFLGRVVAPGQLRVENLADAAVGVDARIRTADEQHVGRPSGHEANRLA